MLVLLAACWVSGLLAADTPPISPARGQITCAPDWSKVTWETRYDQAKLAHVQLNAKSLLPDQLAAITKVDATFKPPQGQEVILNGGWEHGYVFDNSRSRRVRLCTAIQRKRYWPQSNPLS